MVDASGYALRTVHYVHSCSACFPPNMLVALLTGRSTPWASAGEEVVDLDAVIGVPRIKVVDLILREKAICHRIATQMGSLVADSRLPSLVELITGQGWFIPPL